MALLDMQGGFLYQHKRSLFPEGEITGTELLLWELYYKDKNARSKH
jgi:hypothetical protein